MNGHVYTPEENEWLKTNYYQHTLGEVVRMFNETFNASITESGLKCHITKVARKRQRKSRAFTPEMDKWLYKNFPVLSNKELGVQFNKHFGTSFCEKNICQHCNNFLRITKANFRWTEQEDEWLRANYPRHISGQETYREFCELFGAHHSLQSVTQRMHHLGVNKRVWTNEENEWLYANYLRDVPTMKLYEEFCLAFPDRKTFCAFQTRAKQFGLGTVGRGQFKPGNINYKQKKRIELGVGDTDLILSSLGNGEYILMDKKIHKKLSRVKGNLGAGEVTRALYDIELVRRELKKYE